MGFPAARTCGPHICRSPDTTALSEQWVYGHGDVTATASAAFPLGHVRRAAGFTAKSLVLVPTTWVFPLLSPSSHSPAALEKQRVSRRCCGRKSCLQCWRWVKPLPAGPVWVLCVGRGRGAPLISKLSWVPPPFTGFTSLSVAHSPHHSWTSQTPPPKTFPSSPQLSCPRVPLTTLSHASFS